MAMLTTDCMRLASAARNAVRISGAAEIAATRMAVTTGGAPVPSRPRSRVLDITSANAPITTTPNTSRPMDSVRLTGVGSSSRGVFLRRLSG
ncbi:hypothetical protein D3C86_1805160 [compost metagenome]